MLYDFKRTTNGFNYVFEKELAANEEIILKMPPISPNKRGVNDIGFSYDGDVTLYGTLSSNPEGETAIWQEIMPFDEVNKTISYIKIVNNSADKALINIRVLMN